MSLDLLIVYLNPFFYFEKYKIDKSPNSIDLLLVNFGGNPLETLDKNSTGFSLLILLIRKLSKSTIKPQGY